VRLITQPDDGIEPVLQALRSAKKSIHILVFRLDRSEIEKALVDAVSRGVAVHALIAYTNRGGEKNLRRFEMRLLERGVTVTRTADDLVRYHGKMFLIDEKELYLLSFNYTHLDITLSRSFALALSRRDLVEEALRLFDCDSRRLPYENKCDDLVVSPVNARRRLTEFIAGAKKQLLMYEMKISDNDFIRLLNEKVSQGVDVRVIGRASTKDATLQARKLPIRLHTRAILRDGKDIFLGSQSLRKLELEARREIGVIVHDAKLAKQMIEVFDKDWRSASPPLQTDAMATALDAQAKKVAKSVAKQISMKPIIEQILDKAIEAHHDGGFEPKEVAQTVREAFREEVHDAVVHALQELVTVAVLPEEDKAAK
jgi:cardiolipin synthase A/B